MKFIAMLAGGLLAAAAGTSGAVVIRGAPGAGAAPAGAAAARAMARAASADSAPTLISGQVGAVDLARHTVTIAGRELQWHESKLQVFYGRGGRASPAALQVGTPVRFALEPGSGDGRKIVLVYIEGRP